MKVTFLTNEDETRILSAATAESVLFTEQALTETQKSQARANIGAISLADIPESGNKTYEKIATITAAPAEDGSLPRYMVFSVDDAGNSFALTDFMVKAYAGFADGNKSTLYMTVNNQAVITNGTVGSISAACRYFNIFYRQEENGFRRVEYTGSAASDAYFNAQCAIDVSRVIPPMSSISSQPVSTISLYTDLGDTKAWVEGSTFELWGIRA
ncbi:MAG: hypothetical protein IJO72_02550 [Oscillospiraceae bacterium]|nr:hypothetical protein [Oscillospiraceae bacterium]MBQ9929643.1 hypothetical protein [Oscillospiraceae bacterium]